MLKGKKIFILICLVIQKKEAKMYDLIYMNGMRLCCMEEVSFWYQIIIAFVLGAGTVSTIFWVNDKRIDRRINEKH